MALDERVEGASLAVARLVGLARRGIAGPVAGKLLRRDGLELGLERALARHRYQQIKGGIALDMVEEFRGEVLGIGQREGLPGVGG